MFGPLFIADVVDRCFMLNVNLMITSRKLYVTKFGGRDMFIRALTFH